MCKDINKYTCRHESIHLLPCQPTPRHKKRATLTRISQVLQGWSPWRHSKTCDNRSVTPVSRKCDECLDKDAGLISPNHQSLPKLTYSLAGDQGNNVREPCASRRERHTIHVDGPLQLPAGRHSTGSSMTLISGEPYWAQYFQEDKSRWRRCWRRSIASALTLLQSTPSSRRSSTLASFDDTAKTPHHLKPPPVGEYKEKFFVTPEQQKARRAIESAMKKNESTDSLVCHSAARTEGRENRF